MDISEVVLKLIFVLFPGAIAAMIYERLTVHKEWTPFKFILHSTLFGMVCYLVLQVLICIPAFLSNIFCGANKDYMGLKVWDTINGEKIIPYWEVLKASLLSIIIGGIATTINYYKVLNNIAQRFKISNKYGDENLFSYFLNAKEIEVVYIRHPKNNLTYRGYIKSFSETEHISEIVLSNVSVYEYENSELLYEVDQIYLSFIKTEIIIEKAILKTE